MKSLVKTRFTKTIMQKQTISMRLQTVPDIDVIKLHVNIDKIAVLKLYESFGFAIVGREDLTFGDGKQYEAYWMEKELK